MGDRHRDPGVVCRRPGGRVRRHELGLGCGSRRRRDGPGSSGWDPDPLRGRGASLVQASVAGSIAQPIPLNGLHTPRRSRLLRDFEQAARRVKPLIVSGYGVQAAEEWMGEARRDFDSLIPAIPYLGGKQPFTQFVISSAWCLAIYRTLDRRHEPLETLGGVVLALVWGF